MCTLSSLKTIPFRRQYPKAPIEMIGLGWNTFGLFHGILRSVRAFDMKLCKLYFIMLTTSIL